MGLLHVAWEFLRKLSTFSISHQRPHKTSQEEGGCAEGSVPRASLREGRGEGWSLPHHVASSIPLHYRIILTPSTCSQEHWALSGAGWAWHGACGKHCTIVMLPAWAQRPKTAGHHPKPVPAARLPGGSLA